MAKKSQDVVGDSKDDGKKQALSLALSQIMKPPKKAVPKRLPAELEELQEKIRRYTGLKSTLTGSVTKGRIVLQYSSREELERLNELLGED